MKRVLRLSFLGLMVAAFAGCSQKNNGDTYSGLDPGSGGMSGGESTGGLGGIVETYPAFDRDDTTPPPTTTPPAPFGCALPVYRLNAGAAEPGPVTLEQVNCFLDFLNYRMITVDAKATSADTSGKTHYLLEPAPNNYTPQNAWSFGNAGNAIESLAIAYELSAGLKSPSERRPILDKLIHYADAALLVRNDLGERRLMWTGKTDDPVWPGNSPTFTFAKFSSPVDGDIAGHIAHVAKQILATPELWNEASPSQLAAKFRNDGPTYTYLELALLYVSEVEKTMEFLERNFIAKNQAGRHVEQYPLDPNRPGTDYRISYGSSQSRNPVIPWDQQAMINNGFQRLVECYDRIRQNHITRPADPRGGPAVPNWRTLQVGWTAEIDRALVDRIKAYDMYVRDSLEAFFRDLQLTEHLNRSQSNPEHATYLTWRYATGGPLETMAHGNYVLGGLFRAYQSGRYRDWSHQPIPSAARMQQLANGQVDVVAQSRPGFCIPKGETVFDPDRDVSWSYYVDGTTPSNAGIACSPRPASLFSLSLRPDAYERIAPRAVRGADFFLYAHLLSVKSRISW